MSDGAREFLFTSESVTEGHPDKVADQISDGVLDAVLRDDPAGRVACETLVNTGLVVISGEISTETYVDDQKTAAYGHFGREDADFTCGGADDARREDHPDLRGHERDPARHRRQAHARRVMPYTRCSAPRSPPATGCGPTS